jgi:hypothetical protein
MMESLEYVPIPPYFSDLLRANMQGSAQSVLNVKSVFTENKGAEAILKTCFKEVDPNTRFDKIFQTLGWLGFRDRLAASFLHYQLKGFFSEEVDLQLIQDLLGFESRLESCSVEGFSRGFLLAFYFKMSYVQFLRDHPDREFKDFFLRPEIFQALKLIKTKNIKVDWLLLMLNQFMIFLGSEKVLQYLKEGKRYQDLYDLLNEDQINTMTRSFLSYGASINEEDIFVGDFV